MRKMIDSTVMINASVKKIDGMNAKCVDVTMKVIGIGMIDCQWRENQQHDNTMNEIEAGLLGFVVGSVVN
jgi:hypothetical protein